MSNGMDPNESVWALVVDPSNSVPWAGTRRSGVFRYDSIEQQWVRTNNGLTTKCIADLEISNNGKVLYAATTGEGVFRYEKQ
jgi:ligand-binding sensor domain-containing protein